MHFKKLALTLVVALTLVFSVGSVSLVNDTSSVSAHSPRPGGWKPDNVWTGPLPEVCTAVYNPVHDALGKTYGNECEAARKGVLVTWNGKGHTLFP
jgi:hypothetical protein